MSKVAAENEYTEMINWIHQNKLNTPDEDVPALEGELVKFCERSEERQARLDLVMADMKAAMDKKNEGNKCERPAKLFIHSQLPGYKGGMKQYWEYCRRCDEAEAAGYSFGEEDDGDDQQEYDEMPDEEGPIAPPNTPSLPATSGVSWAKMAAGK